MSNRVKVFGYRLMHASVPCAALEAYMRERGHLHAVCKHCPALGGCRRRPLETYTHLFLACPVYRPAVQWLADLWQHISGSRPPVEAAVIIADQPGAWAAAPTGEQQRLWTALRLVVLHAVWEARCSRDAARQTARAVVLAVIASLREEMSLQFTRWRLADTGRRDLPPHVMKMRRLEAAPDDFDVWQSSGLCSVEQVSFYGGRTFMPRRLNLLLDDLQPVPVPP